MEETIDILLPTYNGEKYVKEQLDSILSQDYPQIRLLISDDCSKDNTISILKEYEQKDSRIKVFLQKENFGVIRNIEFLLGKVQANYFMLADQDDVWLAEKVSKSLEKLKEENADLVFGDLKVVDENLKEIYPSFNDFMLLSTKIQKFMNTKQLNYLYNCVTGCTILSKKEQISNILPLPCGSKYMLHDHWIGLIISLHGKVAYLNKPYILYRQHGNNEVGAQKVTHSMCKFEDVRNLLIKVKLGVFETYCENNHVFPDELKALNLKALEYYKSLEKIKYLNFKNWSVFHELYKTEKKMYYIENWIILNFPLIAKLLFKIRYTLLKLFKKR